MSDLTKSPVLTEAMVERLVYAWLGRRCPATQETYAKDIRCWGETLGMTPNEAIAHLLTLGPGAANAAVVEMQAAMQAAGRAPAFIARRTSALKSIVSLARLFGLVSWDITVQAPKVAPYRDCRGPDPKAVLALIRHYERRAAQGHRHACRTLALVRLMCDHALRIGEARVLMWPGDVRLSEPPEPSQVLIRGKGDGGAATVITLAPGTAGVLRAWLDMRGPAPGPVFPPFPNAVAFCADAWPLSAAFLAAAPPMSEDEIRRALARASRQIGVRKIKPHGLRHASITRALDVTGGNLRDVQKFSRHKCVQHVMRYDDARQDRHAAVAQSLTWEDADDAKDA